ncbi:hypothetical protein EJ08DRAFT_637171 [Tothia fuscella]|uniref:DUF155 domain-containing protein n=1 Tax=Tothia fuscella TaxID=1048955 RepID=A0A9P4NMJ3_9PEZI|nr:hypothetical protein EJ08DRAFT_637171 [Tothia fuscella]
MFAIRGNEVKVLGGLRRNCIPRRPPLDTHLFRYLSTPTVFKRNKPAEVQDESTAEKVADKEKESPKENGAKPPRKTSLRRVGLEAERSRVVVKHKGGKRIIERGVETKKLTAYCAAEQYSIHRAARLVKADGFELDPFNTELYPQVVHVQTPIFPSTPLGSTYQEHGDLFIFPSGTVVAWNVPDRIALRLIEQVLPPAALNSDSGTVQMETEDMEYIEDSTKERSFIIGDTIVVGTNANSRNDEESGEESALETSGPEKDTVLAKIAFSSGLARSTKLAVLERLTETYFDSTRSIPTIMSRGTPMPFEKPYIVRRFCEILGFGSRLPFSRPFILRKTGELLSIRAQLNLYSELTDSLPDLFWDSKHELGLEGYYDHVGKALDVGVRIKVLNDKLNYAQEIANTLRETLSERHDLRLEWIIIILIAIEVAFELRRLFKEHKEKGDPDNLEYLLMRYLKKELETENKKT